jgi:hypothetical protein
VWNSAVRNSKFLKPHTPKETNICKNNAQSGTLIADVTVSNTPAVACWVDYFQLQLG